MAESDGKIYITISDKRGGDEKDPRLNDPFFATGGKSESDKSESFKKTNEYIMMRFIEGQAKQAVSYTIGNIGNFTGDYQLQSDVQQVVSLTGQVLGIVASFKVGGVIGGSLALAGSIINTGYRAATNAFNIYKENKQTEQLRQISGLSVLTNGSR